MKKNRLGLSHFKNTLLETAENNDHRGEYNCTADLLFDGFGLYLTSKIFSI